MCPADNTVTAGCGKINKLQQTNMKMLEKPKRILSLLLPYKASTTIYK